MSSRYLPTRLMPVRLLLAAAPVALLAACAQPAPESGDAAANAPADAPANNEAVLAEIDAVEQGLQAAFNADDVAAAMAVYAPGAGFFNGGSAPVTGIESIKGVFEAMTSDENNAIELARISSWVAASGELAVTTATYKYTYTGEDGKPATVNGINQTVWTKQADGGWKIASDFNAGTE